MPEFSNSHPKLTNAFAVAAGIGVFATSVATVFGALALAVHSPSLVHQAEVVACAALAAGFIEGFGLGLINRMWP